MLHDGWSQPIPGVDVWRRRGASEGPRALVTAGVHGDEYEGPAAAVELIQSLEGRPLAGELIVIPVCNPMAWKGATRLSPEDGLNLARVFPGLPTGRPTEHLADSLFGIARECDFVIDLHSGGSDYRFLPLAGYYGDKSFEAARRFGLPVLWKLPETQGVLSCELHRLGRTTVGCEYLGAGQLSPEGVAAYTAGLRSCLALWGLLPGEIPLPPGGEAFTGDWMLAAETGQFFAHVSLGADVEQGALLASIRNPRGEVLQSYHAPTAGRVLALRTKGYIRSGDWAVLVATHA